jgi:threonylcarbamoyladenosine tRNA methylthiotransferase MtaB
MHYILIIYNINDICNCMNVYIETHGCKLNIADSQKISKEFLSSGFTISEDINKSEIFVLNTCTVTKSADKKARNRLRSIKKNHPNIHLIATGCYPQRNKDEVLALGIVDTIIKNEEKNNFIKIISEKFSVKNNLEDNYGLEKILLGRTRASIAIQKGCNQICSYCIVPKVRGSENSIEPKEIINQINYLESKGCKEVVLTGTQLGTYGFDLKNYNLYKLLKEVLENTQILRLRLSSVQPHEFNKDLLSLWNHKDFKKRLCPHFHIPLQSGSNKILKSMRRKYTISQFTDITKKIKSTIENASITTDLIVGFPDETETDHINTKKLLKNSNITEIHVFPYSIRPGTTAFYLDNKIQPSIITKRAKEIREISNKLKIKHLLSLINSEQNVLWENSKKNSGYTENYSYFSLSGNETRFTNSSISKVKIKSIENQNLIGLISK